MPPYVGFCGPSNPSQSVLADCERTINWYKEQVESPAAPTGSALYPTPGTQILQTMGKVDPRAVFAMADRAFAIYGSDFCEIFADNTFLVRGSVVQDLNPATISYNGTAGGHLFITSGGNGYCYVLATNTLTTVLGGEATMGGMINARFLCFNKLNGRVRLSALNDGTTWDPNLFFARTLAPDPWQAMVISPPEIWLIGEQTGEVWYDSGAFPQPFAPINGAFFKYGTSAPWSVAIAGDSLVWLSRGKDGAGSVVAARGYTPQVISNFAVDTALATYQRTSVITDAETLVYADQGHIFACFSFPSAKATWVCDLSLRMAWHERGAFDVASGRYTVWGPRVHAYAFGKHLVGLRNTATLASMDITFGSEADGSVIRRLRIPPPIWAAPSQRLIVSRFELMAETGLGLAAGQGSDPKVMARFSRNAKTWSAELQASAGKMGDYARRIVWNRCGSSDRLWVPEITVSDPVPWRISGAMIDGEGIQQQSVPTQMRVA